MFSRSLYPRIHKEYADVLFLDFDGVLHPLSGGQEFSLVPKLLPLFSEFPRLRVVFTTDWRFAFDFAGLYEKVGPLSPYCIGETPKITDLHQTHFPGEPQIPFSREREILWYLHEHPEVRNWVAVDDIPDLFEPNFVDQHVLITDAHTGISDTDIATLRKHFSAV